MTAKQLTDSILQLAIQGKLVPQNPNDEPASVLLDKIREEKSRLIKEGLLKKEILEVTPIKEEEYPFSIPKSWEWIRLNYVSNIARGGSPRPIKEFLTDAPNGVNWIKISDSEIGGKYIYSTKEKIKPEGVSRSRYVHVDDFLLTNSMSFGRPYILKTEGCIHDGWLVISLDKNSYDQDFMYYLLSSRFAKKSFTDKAAGAVVKNLNIDKVAESIFPLPPLAEQHRIVERIEEILPFVKEYGEAYEEASKMDAELPDKLKKSILQEAIMGKLGTQDPNDDPASVLLEQIREEKKKLVKEGVLKKRDLEETPFNEDEEPFKIPESWEWCKIDTIFQHTSGKQLKGGDTEGELHQYITTSNLYWDKFVLDNLKTMYYKSSELARCTATKGDLLVCEGGDVGRCAIWPYDFDICLQNHVHRLRPYCKFNIRYVMYVLMLFKAKGLIGGKGIGIKGLSASALKDINIPLPPLAEQHRIVERIEELYAEIDNMTINKDINETEIEEKEV